MKLYPDRWGPRLRLIAGDLFAVLWLIAWFNVASTLYNIVMALTPLAQGVGDAGHTIDHLIAQFEQTAQQNVPLVGDWLAGLGRGLDSVSGAPLVAVSQQSIIAIQHLAIFLAVIIGLPPLFAGWLIYIPWRWRRTRDFRALHLIARRALPTDSEALLRLLAIRSLATLPPHELLRVSPNPAADWNAGNLYDLAAACMDNEGLDLRRYLIPRRDFPDRPVPPSASPPYQAP